MACNPTLLSSAEADLTSESAYWMTGTRAVSKCCWHEQVFMSWQSRTSLSFLKTPSLRRSIKAYMMLAVQLPRRTGEKDLSGLHRLSLAATA